MSLTVRQELVETLRRPWRLLNVVSLGKWKRRFRFERIRAKAGTEWGRLGGDGSLLGRRRFASYEDYLDVQKSKLEFLDLDKHERKFREALFSRLKTADFLKPGASVVCIGARLGAEVRAFLDCGCFAVGVDLNPGDANPVVLPGDFHNLVFADDSVDVVYSNSLDHCFDLRKLCDEVRRVLVPEGLFVVEADPGSKDTGGIAPDMWSSLSWEHIDGIEETLLMCGFTPIQRKPFDYPRGGEQLVLRAKPVS